MVQVIVVSTLLQAVPRDVNVLYLLIIRQQSNIENVYTCIKLPVCEMRSLMHKTGIKEYFGLKLK